MSTRLTLPDEPPAAELETARPHPPLEQTLGQLQQLGRSLNSELIATLWRGWLASRLARADSASERAALARLAEKRPWWLGGADAAPGAQSDMTLGEMLDELERIAGLLHEDAASC